MANTNNYAEQFSPDLLEILVQGTLTSPFITSNVKWVGARTFHFTQMSTSGFKNHNRNGGWNKGKLQALRTSQRHLNRHRLLPKQTHFSSQRLQQRLRQQTDIILQQRCRSGLRRTLIQSSKQFSLPASSADTRQEAHLLPM